jgi:hypothetical protein
MEKQVLTTEHFEKVVREAYDSGMMRPITYLSYYRRENNIPCGCAMGAFSMKEFNTATAPLCEMIEQKYIILRNDLYKLMDGFDGRNIINKDNEWYKLGQKLHNIYIKKENNV